MAEITIIEIAQHCCFSGMLHRKVMMRTLPGFFLRGMTTGTVLAADEISTADGIAGKGLPGEQQQQNKGKNTHSQGLYCQEATSAGKLHAGRLLFIYQRRKFVSGSVA